MEIAPLPAEEYSALALQKRHRFPEKYVLSLPGNRGTTVRIPVVLGNPSGVCKLPPGEQPSSAWSDFMAAVFKVHDESVGLVRQAAADCLLWPSSAEWGKVVDRWPGAPDALWTAAREKCGASLGVMDRPGSGEIPPEAIAQALERHERATWRWAKPPGHRIAMVVDAPKSAAWSFFSEAMKKRDADRWRLVCEMAEAAIPTAVNVIPATLKEDGREEPISVVSDVLGRWPGFAVLIAATLGELVGVNAKVEREEW